MSSSIFGFDKLSHRDYLGDKGRMEKPLRSFSILPFKITKPQFPELAEGYIPKFVKRNVQIFLLKKNVF
jgi:hypothetical protein